LNVVSDYFDWVVSGSSRMVFVDPLTSPKEQKVPIGIYCMSDHFCSFLVSRYCIPTTKSKSKKSDWA
jgi:hypothetical protein